MKKYARILALLLAVCMITAIFAACTKDGDQEQTSATTPKSDGTTVPDTKPDVTTPAPIDVSGYTFRIMGSDAVFPRMNEGGYANQDAQELAEKLAGDRWFFRFLFIGAKMMERPTEKGLNYSYI